MTLSPVSSSSAPWQVILRLSFFSNRKIGAIPPFSFYDPYDPFTQKIAELEKSIPNSGRVYTGILPTIIAVQGSGDVATHITNIYSLCQAGTKRSNSGSKRTTGPTPPKGQPLDGRNSCFPTFRCITPCDPSFLCLFHRCTDHPQFLFLVALGKYATL